MSNIGLNEIAKLHVDIKELLLNTEHSKEVKTHLMNMETSSAKLYRALEKDAGLVRPYLKVMVRGGCYDLHSIDSIIDSSKAHKSLRLFILQTLEGVKVENILEDRLLTKTFRNLPIMQYTCFYLHCVAAKYSEDKSMSETKTSRFFNVSAIPSLSTKKYKGPNENLWYFAYFYLHRVYGKVKTLQILREWEELPTPTFTNTGEIGSIVENMIVKIVMEEFGIGIVLK